MDSISSLVRQVIPDGESLSQVGPLPRDGCKVGDAWKVRPVLARSGPAPPGTRTTLAGRDCVPGRSGIAPPTARRRAGALGPRPQPPAPGLGPAPTPPGRATRSGSPLLTAASASATALPATAAPPPTPPSTLRHRGAARGAAGARAAKERAGGAERGGAGLGRPACHRGGAGARGLPHWPPGAGRDARPLADGPGGRDDGVEGSWGAAGQGEDGAGQGETHRPRPPRLGRARRGSHAPGRSATARPCPGAREAAARPERGL